MSITLASDIAALDTNLQTGGGTDDTAVLQTAIDSNERVTVDGPALVTGLDVLSSTHLDFVAGSGLYLDDDSGAAILRNANPSPDTITDHDITITGGYFNGNRVHNAGVGPFGGNMEDDGNLIDGLQFFGVEKLKIAGTTLAHCRALGLHLGNVRDVDLRDISVDNADGFLQQGGIEFEGPSSNVTINGLRGATDDDLLSFVSDLDTIPFADPEHPEWPDTWGPYIEHGPITDVAVSNIVGVGAFSAVRLYSTISRIDRLTVNNVAGQFKVWIFCHHVTPVGEANGNVGAVAVSNVVAEMLPTDRMDIAAAVQLIGDVEHLTLTNWQVKCADSRPFLRVGAGTTIGILDITELSWNDGEPIPVVNDGHINTLIAKGWLGGYILSGSGTIGEIIGDAVPIAAVVEDHFTGTNGTQLNNRAPDTVSAGAWNQQTGTPAHVTVQGNEARIITTGTEMLVLPAAANGSLTAVARGSGAWGIQVRTNVEGNGWLLWLGPTGAAIYKAVSGTWTSPWNDGVTRDVTVANTLHAVSEGNNIAFYINGTLVYTVTGDSFNATEIHHGIRAYNGTFYFTLLKMTV